jgi:peptide methionine sulfoxide reductase msrA/msrB
VLKKLLLIVGIVMSLSCDGYAQEDGMKKEQLEKAVFGGGCFWCMQPEFDREKGIKQTLVGYMGGHTNNPTYEDVSSGDTGHAEVIEITYDPKEVSYEKLLEIFWQNIDPTQENAQFVDYGTQYRSAIFYHNEEQKRLAEQSKKELQSSGRFDGPIVTEIVPASKFYPAEDYHQKYYQKSSWRYQMYHDNTGREEFKEKHWGKEAH